VKGLDELMQNQRGIVLAGSLMILSALALAGVAARVMLQNDHRTSANMRTGSQSFYLAASGIEWGKSEILLSPGLTPAPSDRSVDFNNGKFSVSFVSAPNLSPLSAQFIVRSLGSVGRDSHMLLARLSKIYDLTDGAVGLRGNIQGVHFAGASIAISGVDHDPATGRPAGAAMGHAAASTDSQSLSDLVGVQAASLPAGSFHSAAGDPPIAPSRHLASAALSQLADRLCTAPGVIPVPLPVTGALTLANQTWGTPTTPQLRCIEGISGAGDALTLIGDSSGAGILIVRNADIILNGAMRWEGLILVTDSDVSLKTGAASTTNIFGSVLINETGSPSHGALALDNQGSLRASYSRLALNRAAGLIPSGEFAALYASLPASLKQDFWRSVSP
jgi:hypothetical protein